MNDNDTNEDNDFEFGIHLSDLTDADAASEAFEAEPSHDKGRTDAAIPEQTRPDELSQSASGAGEPPPSKPVLTSIAEIKGQLADLSRDFESKLKYDAHKDKVIDELHQALQQHRDGLLKKYLQRVFTDVIKIVDDVRKLTGHYREQPATEENSAKLVQYLEDVAHDLEDVFAWEGIVSFNTDSDFLDPTRQRVVSKVEIGDPAKDKMIAERLRPGYEWDGKVIRPEIVTIYVCNQGSEPEARRSDE
jgi:molecular chaperone GrpE (heat shock protein)